MSVPTDNSSAVSEHDSHSDSDWLDIASTDRDSDDNDSVYSSREIDHEDLSRSRSRRSSLSYGSSRDGDVDAWEGLIDDSADEGMSNDVPAPNHHVPSLSQQPAPFDSDPTQETSPEELRVNEGLDQSMISTLSSSRSSSLHTSIVHSSSRDLRLSFPDPITSSCRELSTSYEEVRRNSDVLSSPTDADVSSDARQADDEEMLSASQMLSTQLQGTSSPVPSGPELQVFLYGRSASSKWTIVNTLLRKVARGAALTITPDVDDLQGTMRQLTVSGPFERDRAFPRTITVLDRTLYSHDTVDDLTVTNSTCIRPLAVVFIPCGPLHLPEHVLCLPVLVSPSFSGPHELPDFGILGTSTAQEAWDVLSIPDRQVLRVTPEGSPVVDGGLIENMDPSRVHRTFSRLWSSDNDAAPKGTMTGTHALTIIAILSLVLGVIVRAAIPFSFQPFSSPTLVTLSPNCTSGLWQMLRPAPYRERLPPSTTFDNSVVTIPSPLKEFSLSVFSAESTSIMLSHAHPTNFRRVIPSTTQSERFKFPKDLMLQPSYSVLPPDNRPKALSVIPDPSPSRQPGPVTAGQTVSALVQTSVSGVVKECATVVFSVMNKDMQDILDALDALVQAISRQRQIVLTQATTFIEHSTKHLENTVESFETIKETLHARNERARKRAKEIKEMGSKWLYDTSEVVVASAAFSKEIAREMAEGLAHRAERARGKAKEMAAEIQDFVSEQERLEALGTGVWYTQTQHWDEWVKRVRMHGSKGKFCKHSRHKVCNLLL